MKYKAIIFLLPFIISSCSHQEETRNAPNIIKIGDYTIEFPRGFENSKEDGIDSKVGSISNGQITFRYDFGYYSNSLTPSLDEYLSRDVWKWNALAYKGLLPGGRDPQYFSARTDLINYELKDSSRYELKLVYERDTILYKVDVPLQISQSQIEFDTINQVAFKYVNGPEYQGLYAVDLESYNKSINSYLSLSIYVDSTNRHDAEKVMSILKSCKHKK